MRSFSLKHAVISQLLYPVLQWFVPCRRYLNNAKQAKHDSRARMSGGNTLTLQGRETQKNLILCSLFRNRIT